MALQNATPVCSILHSHIIGWVDVVDTDEGYFVATAWERNGYNEIGAYVHPDKALAVEMATDAVIEHRYC